MRVTQRWNPDLQTNPIIGTDIDEPLLDSIIVTNYVGNKIYENGELKKILVDGGYYDYEKEEYFFYIQDHLGNNRVVVNQNDSVVQRSDYYPFGMEFADNSGNDQPYKYNGKELDKMHGLNMYDYSARYTDPAYGRFTTVDPHAENYYSISPYVYVGNNPMRITDPTGMDWFVDNESGNVVFVRGVSDLSTLDDRQVEMYAIGNIDSYERLGADDMFGNKVTWGEDGNILDFVFANMMGDSESFINNQGYEKAEKVTVREKTTYYGGSFGPNENVKHEYNSENIINKKVSYVTPDKLNTQKMIERTPNKREAFCVTSSISIDEYIIPYGQDFSTRANPNKNSNKKLPVDKNTKESYKTIAKFVSKFFKYFK